MNLLRLLTERRPEILTRCQKKITEVMGSRSTSALLDKGLPALYEEIIEVLQSLASDTTAEAKQRSVAETITASATRKHAQEAYRLGYTVAQLVHGYGCVCQAITEYAFEIGANIEASEFSQLNLSLDVAIAQAVSEFQVLSLQNAERGELLRMGFLVHELRNALTAVTMSHELIKMGGVGASGATSAILSSSLLHMKELLDRSIAEVRLRGKPTIARVQLSLLGLISQIEASALPEANAKGICLRVDGDPTIEVAADPHLVTSAVANVVQNAIKFTKFGGEIWIRVFNDGEQAVIEVEDRCGGIPTDKMDLIFGDYVQDGADKTGLGLGLSIARRAMELNGGDLTAVNLPGTGCIFVARMPLALPEASSALPRAVELTEFARECRGAEALLTPSSDTPGPESVSLGT